MGTKEVEAVSYCFKTREELLAFIRDELINTAEVMEILNCSRQNVFDLIRRGKLTPVKESAKERLFLRADVMERVKE